MERKSRCEERKGIKKGRAEGGGAATRSREGRRGGEGEEGRGGGGEVNRSPQLY